MANELATRTLTTKPIARETLYEDGVNEVVELKVDGTGGTYTLTFDGEETGTISATAAAATVQTALEALDAIDAGDVAVSGGPGNSGGTTPYTVEFTGDLGAQDVGALTADDALVTGGGSAVTITVTTPGTDGNVVANHLTDVVTDPEAENAVQTLSHEDYPSANQVGADALSVHEEQTPNEVFE